MTNVIRSAVLCVLALGAFSSLRAETLVHGEAGLQFDIPDGWTHEQDGDFLVGSSKDKDIVMWFMVGKEAEAGEFLKAMGTELDKILEDAKPDGKEPKVDQANGLTFVYVEGTGKLKAEKFAPAGKKASDQVQWDLTLVTGGKKLMAIVSIGKLDVNEAMLTKLWNSIKKKE